MTITFYDIASAAPVTCFAPNPWKTRFCLNFKNTPYQTAWTSLPTVTTVRKSLNLPANRTHRDGSPFYTLPIITDSTANKNIGDSFEIAIHLDKTYPSSTTLFPPESVGTTAAFNQYVDGLFSQFWGLFIHGLPFDPDSAEESRATFVDRAGAGSWEELNATGEERVRMLGELEGKMGELAKAYRIGSGCVAGEEGRVGPFLNGGDRPTYADFIVGAWLMFYKATVPEWEAVRSWDGGLWGRVYDALQEFTEVK